MKNKVHIFLLKRRYVLALAVLAVSAGIFYAVSYPAAQAAYATDRQLPIYCVDCGEDKRCAISFDAAWGDVRVRQLYFQRFADLDIGIYTLSIKNTNVGMAHDSKRYKWQEKTESIKSQKNGICEKRKSQEGWEMSVSMGPTFLLFFDPLCWDFLMWIDEVWGSRHCKESCIWQSNSAICSFSICYSNALTRLRI